MKKKTKIFSAILTSLTLALLITLAVFLPLKPKSEEVASSYFDSTWGHLAAERDKGGAIIVEEGSNYVMKGGVISGKENVYGGAVYVCKNASFTMEGGEIRNCRARYGGAIYVERGGRVVINGGIITKNNATVAPAIYVEDGGRIQVGSTAQIFNNRYCSYFRISKDTTRVGGDYSSSYRSYIYVKTTHLGYYPQTYVGNKMNQTLEDWYQENMPTEDLTYHIGDQEWKAYVYTDNGEYVRGFSKKEGTSTAIKYKNNEEVKATGEVCWFKLEPIKWYILNYDNWSRGLEYIKLLSEICLTGNVRFNSEEGGPFWETSELRTWLNTEFLNTAFNTAEQSEIRETEVLNNVAGDYQNSTSDGLGETTYDLVYIPSYYELISGEFGKEGSGDIDAKRMSSMSDFALSNNIRWYGSYTTAYRTATTDYFSRSIYADGFLCGFNGQGVLITSDGGTKCDILYFGVRPALRLNYMYPDKAHIDE